MTIKERMGFVAFMLLHPISGGVLLWKFLCMNAGVRKDVVKRRPIIEWMKQPHNGFEREIEYEKANPGAVFPYPQIKEKGESRCGYDKNARLPYVIHQERRLYFPWYYRAVDAKHAYETYCQIEGLLGAGILAKSPHCYVTSQHTVDKGDILIDVGCAEALFALNFADSASRIYLFEVDSKWYKPLQLTFEQYKDKTVCINKLVSNRSVGNEVRLQDVIESSDSCTYFLKMDIEGWERQVLLACKDFLMSHRVKISCCVYHRQDDAEVIDKLLKEFGYTTSFSDGYMLPLMNELCPPYFRKGMIYGRNFDK